jgi:hypothetical protein
MKAKMNEYRILGNRKERDHDEDPDVGRRIILRYIIEKYVGLNSCGSG